MDTAALSFALGAGLLAAVNPCGFALLPAYLGLLVLDGDADRAGRGDAVLRALRATAALTLGFVAVFGVFGLAIAPVAASIQQHFPWVTVVVGLVLVGAGGWVLSGRRLPAPGMRGRSGGAPLTASFGSMVGFGASYAVASLTCTIAPFLVVVVGAFRAGSLLEGVALFAAYALGMGLVVGTAAVAVALARDGLVRRVRRLGGIVPRVAGVLLVGAGAYVAWYGAWELRVLLGGAGADPVVAAAGDVQRWLATTVGGLGAALLATVLGALVVTGLLLRRRGAPAVTDTEVDAPARDSNSA